MPSSAIKVGRRNSPALVAEVPLPNRRRPLRLLVRVHEGLLDAYGRPLGQRPSLSFPGIMPSIPMGLDEAAAPVAISYITENSVASATQAPSGGASGDVVIGFALNNNANVAPTAPASPWEALATTATNSVGLAAGWTYYNTTSVSWTNGTHLIYLIYRGANQTDAVGDHDGNNTNLTTWPCPGKTFVSSNPWVVWCGCANSTSVGTPAGLTSRRNLITNFRAGDTNGTVASFSATTGSLGTAQRAAGISIELID